MCFTFGVFVDETPFLKGVSHVTIDPRLYRIVAAQPYPLLFATISGAHFYGFGFPSPPQDRCPKSGCPSNEKLN